MQATAERKDTRTVTVAGLIETGLTFGIGDSELNVYPLNFNIPFRINGRNVLLNALGALILGGTVSLEETRRICRDLDLRDRTATVGAVLAELKLPAESRSLVTEVCALAPVSDPRAVMEHIRRLESR